MIFYFTGTGNSYHVAKEMALVTKEKLVNMGNLMEYKNDEYELQPGERIGFVFPVYYWGMPTVVEEYIKKLSLKQTKDHYVYAILTCGATVGTTINKLNRLLSKKKLKLDSGYSIACPDNYILLYDVPEQEEQKKLLNEMDLVLEKVKQDVEHRIKDVFCVKRGKAPHLLSGILHSYYKRNRKTTRFYATEACVNCGLCEKICPVNSITLVDGMPQWGKECTQCLGCINRCPTKAIQYGKRTEKRGRYVHPDLLPKKDTNE